jgi:hypothetical protein
VVCVPASGSTFPLGETTVTCTATDAAGNHSQGTFKVTVRDTTAPVVTCPADMTVEATGPSGAVATFTATATDLVDPAPTVVCVPASGSTFPLGETTVTCTATDATGNHSQGTFKVTVRDTTAPVLTCPADIKVMAAAGDLGKVVTFDVPATDIVDSSPTVTCAPPSGSTFALGSTTVVCSATDDSGNRSECSFKVAVILFGDFDEDCRVDLFDLLMLMDHYNSSQGDGRYDPLYDVNSDGTVNLFDLILAANHFGSTCTQTWKLGAVAAPGTKKALAPVGMHLASKTTTVEAGKSLVVEVDVRGSEVSIGGVQTTLAFDPAVFSEVGWEELDYLRKDGSSTLSVPAPAPDGGQSTTVGIIRFPMSGFAGEGSALKYVLRVKDDAPLGITAIDLKDPLLATPEAKSIPVVAEGLVVTVAGLNSVSDWELYE